MNKITVRIRPELILTAQHTNRGRYWLVEDPVALKYFHLRDEECFVLRSLVDGITLTDLKRQFNEHFHPLKIGLRQLNRFLFHLHELGLVVSDIQGQGEVLARRNRTGRRKRIMASLANPLAIRLPGIAAAESIDRFYPAIKILLSKPAIAFWILLVSLASTLVVVNFGAFQNRLPTLSDFLSPTTAIWFAIALALTKALHELGHAFVSKHLGGNCREIGVILLAFVPTLYCDVSDAWRMPNRLHRILVSLAGIFTEMVLAAIVTIIWWFTKPGDLQTIALYILFFCSVSTFLFNINPLIRCDGYYVLSDLTNTPNLWQESRAQWRRAWKSWFSGQPMANPQQTPRSHVFPLMAYAAASTIYCWALIAGILWMTFRILEPAGLASLAWTLTAMVVIGYFGPSFFAAAKMASSPVRRREYRVNKLATAATVAVCLGAMFFFLPLTNHISAPFVIELADSRPIFAPVSGTLKYAIPDQSTVTAGDRLIELESDQIDLRIAETSGEVAQHQQRLASLQKMLLSDPSVAPLIPGEQQALVDATDRLNLWQQDRDRLVFHAPIDGTLFSPPPLASGQTGQTELTQWAGSPLEPVNLGAMIQVGQLIGLVGAPGQFRASVLIDQTDVAGVRRGQAVTMRISHLPSRTFGGTIVDISKTNAKDIPDDLLFALGLQSANPDQKSEVYYQATIRFDAEEVAILQGMTGHVKIRIDRITIAGRVSRFLAKHFTIY
jgi:putative peptide zinc metalloprotease protein